jgi:glucose PTS system EIICB or EIICBA component
MLPVSVLPVAGILLGVGSANFSWLPQIVSQIMAQSGGAIFSNLPLLFAIGVAIGLTDNDGVAALASTVGFAVFLAAMGGLREVAGNRAHARDGYSDNRNWCLRRHHCGPDRGRGI